MKSTPPQILYKYTDVVGAEKTLAGKTLKFSHYSQFNDPFDADFRDMYGFEPEEIKQNAQELMKKALEENNPQQFAAVAKLPLNEAATICQFYQYFPPDKKKEGADT